MFSGIDVHVPSFSGNSYLQFLGLGQSALSYLDGEVVIKPTEPTGLVLYNGYTTDRTGDFLSLALANGFVDFRFDLGTGPAVIRYVLRSSISYLCYLKYLFKIYAVRVVSGGGVGTDPDMWWGVRTRICGGGGGYGPGYVVVVGVWVRTRICGGGGVRTRICGGGVGTDPDMWWWGGTDPDMWWWGGSADPDMW